MGTDSIYAFLHLFFFSPPSQYAANPDSAEQSFTDYLTLRYIGLNHAIAYPIGTVPQPLFHSWLPAINDKLHR